MTKNKNSFTSEKIHELENAKTVNDYIEAIYSKSHENKTIFKEQEFNEFQRLYDQASPFVGDMFKELKDNPKSYRALNQRLFQNSTIEEDLENESELIDLFQKYNDTTPMAFIQIKD